MKSIKKRLNGFYDSFNLTCKDLGVFNSLDASRQISNESNYQFIWYKFHLTLAELKDILLDLILALQSLLISCSLLFNSANKSLFGDLLRLNSIVDFNGFDIK